jgi:hypothetical protein
MEESIEADLPLMDSALQRRVLSFTSYCMSRAQRSLDHFTKLWSERGQELSQTIRTAMPLTQSVATAPQTDLDPASSLPPAIPEAADPVPPPAV